MAAIAAVLALLAGALTSIVPGGAGTAFAAGPSVTSFTASSGATVGSPVTFTASATTTTPGATIVAFNFNFGDGTAAQVVAPATLGATATVTTTHAYTSTGTYVATVTATDSTFTTSAPTATPVAVSLSGQRVTASLTASPQQVAVGDTVTFTATASTPNTGAAIQNLSLNFGDGVTQSMTFTPSASVTATATHTYATPGAFTATLTATDNMGNLGQASTQVFVAPSSVPINGTFPYPYYGYPFPSYVTTAPVYTAPVYTTTPVYTAPTTTYTTTLPATYSSVLGISAVNPANGISLSFPLGWNIVAGPTGTIITGNVGPMYAFRPGDTTYEVVPNGSPLQAGWGYWAYFPTPMTEVIPVVGAASQSVPLPAGQFVMIGNPGDGPATVSGADYLVTFNSTTNTYTQISQIPAGQGAWAFSFAGGTATISSS